MTDTFFEDDTDSKNEHREKALDKSFYDFFDYSLKLTTGEVIRYQQAFAIDDEWIHLSNAQWDSYTLTPAEFFPRGIDVRINHIVWVKDAPYGS